MEGHSEPFKAEYLKKNIQPCEAFTDGNNVWKSLSPVCMWNIIHVKMLPITLRAQDNGQHFHMYYIPCAHDCGLQTHVVRKCDRIISHFSVDKWFCDFLLFLHIYIFIAHLHSTTVCSWRNMTLLWIKADLKLTVTLPSTWVVLRIKQVNLSCSNYIAWNSRHWKWRLIIYSTVEPEKIFNIVPFFFILPLNTWSKMQQSVLS